MQIEEKFVMTELFVRGLLRMLEQPEDAKNDVLVANISGEVLHLMPQWTAADSPMREDHDAARD